MVLAREPDPAAQPGEVAAIALPADPPQQTGPSAARVAAISLLAAGVSGLLLGSALPSRGCAVLAWFALVPLLRVCRRVSVAPASLLGFLSGATAGLVALGLPGAGPPGALALALVLECALLIAAACGAAALMRRYPPLLWAVAMGCAGVALERLTFAGFPMHLALCFWRWTGLIQITALTGIWGVSFLVWWANAALAAGSRRDALPMAGPGLVVLLTVIVGGWLAAAPVEDGVAATVGAVQLGDADGPARRALQQEAQARDARLLVFPELVDGERVTGDRLRRSGWRLAYGTRTYCVVGYVERDGSRRYNSAGVFSPRHHLLGSYRKVHLFGGERFRFRAGRAADIVRLPTATIGMPICFDTCYTDVCREMAAMGAVLLATPTADPITPGYRLHALHAAFQPFRSAENGVSIVRADGHALSMITDSHGRVVAMAQAPGRALVARRVQIDARATPYRRWGDWLAYLATAAALCLAAAALLPPSLLTGRSRS